MPQQPQQQCASQDQNHAAPMLRRAAACSYRDAHHAKHVHSPRAHAGDMLSEVRREFDLQRHKQAPYDIKYALSDGRTKLRFLQESIGFSR